MLPLLSNPILSYSLKLVKLVAWSLALRRCLSSRRVPSQVSCFYGSYTRSRGQDSRIPSVQVHTHLTPDLDGSVSMYSPPSGPEINLWRADQGSRLVVSGCDPVRFQSSVQSWPQIQARRTTYYKCANLGSGLKARSVIIMAHTQEPRKN